jgi:mannosyltransferase OCH1-like enzyme
MNKNKQFWLIFLVVISIIIYYNFALTFIFDKTENFICTNTNLELDDFNFKKESNVVSGYIGEQSITIPKIIHQVWFTENGTSSIPSPLNKIENMKTWKNDYLNKYPEFKYVLWTHEKIQKNLYWSDELKKIYNLETTIKGKTDILKLLILQQYGGIFIDTDLIWNSKNNKDLNDLIIRTQNQCSDFFVAREPYQNWISNSVIGACKNSKPLNYLLNKLEDIADGYLEIREKTPSLEVTGSMFVNTVVLRGYPIVIFPDVFFYPRTWTNSKSIYNSVCQNDIQIDSCDQKNRLLEIIPENSYMISTFYEKHW